MKLRAAISADVRALAELNIQVQDMHVKAHPELFKPISENDAALLAYYEDVIADANMVVYVVEAEQKPVGYIVARIQQRPESVFTYSYTTIYIDQIAIHPGYQGRGCGSLLIRAVLALAKEKNIARVALDVWHFNIHSQAFFVSQGFEIEHTRMAYYLNGDK
jgi:ribosomal protein S18 acetylase RimI-like enzyme